MQYPATARQRPFFPALNVVLFLLWLMSPTGPRAQTISGTVQDPSGAVIVGARIEISGGDLQQPRVLWSDALGKFSSSELKPGTYSVRATRDGFEPLVKGPAKESRPQRLQGNPGTISAVTPPR